MCAAARVTVRGKVLLKEANCAQSARPGFRLNTSAMVTVQQLRTRTLTDEQFQVHLSCQLFRYQHMETIKQTFLQCKHRCFFL